MNTTKEFLKLIGVSNETIEAITAEETAEDLNLEDLSKEYISKQKSLSANDPDLIKGIKDEIRGTELSKIEHRIKKQFNLSADDIRDKKFDEILETAFLKVQKESGTSSEELQQKVLDLNKALKQYEEEILPAERQKSKNEIKQFRRDLAVRDILANKSLIVGSEVILPALNKTLNGFEIEINDSNEIEIKTKDGLKPLSKDGTKTLSFNDIIERELNEMNVIRQSNGSPETKTTATTNGSSNGSSSVNEDQSPKYNLAGLKRANKTANELKEMKTFGN